MGNVFPLSDTPTLSCWKNGKAFEGTIDYEVTDGQLRSRAGTTCIPQFSPVMFSHTPMIYKLLLALHTYGMYCFLTSTYALVVGGRLDTFEGITIFMAMTDFRSNPILYGFSFFFSKN